MTHLQVNEIRATVLAVSCWGLMVIGVHGLTASSAWAVSNDFTEGREEVIEGDYQDGLDLLNKYLNENPEGTYASRAWLFVGKAHVGLKQYSQAKAAFRELASRFPDSLEGYKAQYKIAEIEMLMGNQEEARRLFEKMLEDKNGPFTAESQMYLDFLKLR